MRALWLVNQLWFVVPVNSWKNRVSPELLFKSNWPQVSLLYSWRFSPYSAPIHWLVHGHMTSNNETVSHQMPWAGNIAKTMTSNGKQFTAKCWPLLHVMAGISARFSNFAFVLFCYITNYLMTGPLGNSEFCFPRLRLGKCWDSRETIYT